MEKKDFIEKYGFSLEDLEIGCIDNLMRKRFICYSVCKVSYFYSETGLLRKPLSADTTVFVIPRGKALRTFCDVYSRIIS